MTIRIVHDALKVLGRDRITIAVNELKLTRKRQCFRFMTIDDKYCAYGLLCAASPILLHFNQAVFIAAGKNISIVDLNDTYRMTFRQIASCLDAIKLGYSAIQYEPSTQLITGFIDKSGIIDSPIG